MLEVHGQPCDAGLFPYANPSISSEPHSDLA